MKNVSFSTSICHLLGVFFPFFSDLGFASMVKGGPGPNKVEKERKPYKTETKKDTTFIRILSFSQCAFRWFLEESWEVFFCALVAEVSEMGATWGHFTSHVAAKLESWKLGFRVHQTLLFQVLRGWLRRCWATFFKIFSEMGLEMWFDDFLRNWGSSRSSKDDFWWAFQVQVLRWFLMNFQGDTKSHIGQGWVVITRFLGP